MTGESDAERLARVVATPGAKVRSIGEDNQGTDLVDHSEALSSGAAYCVHLREHLIALDLDDPSATYLVGLRERLGGLGWGMVEVSSGGFRPEGAASHLFLSLPVGWLQQDAKTYLHEALGVNKAVMRSGRGTSIRPPLSPHRMGGAGHLIEPTSVDEAVRRLETRPNQTGEPSWLQPLLRDGVDTRCKYLNASGELIRHRAVAGVALAFVNMGRQYVDFEVALKGACSVLAEKANHMGGAELTRAWDSARAHARKEGPTWSRDDEGLRQSREAFTRLSWTGRSGGTDRMVLGAMLGIADEIGSLTVAPGVRRVAEMTGKTKDTVARAFRRLEGFGHLAKVEAAHDSEAASYLITVKVADNRYTSPPIGDDRLCVSVSDKFTLPDAFRGVGRPSAYAVWTTLVHGDTWTTVKDLHGATGLSAGVLRASLKELERLGLTQRNSPVGHRWRGLPADEIRLSALAEERGTIGRQRQQQLDHELQREGYADYRLGRRLIG